MFWWNVQHRKGGWSKKYQSHQWWKGGANSMYALFAQNLQNRVALCETYLQEQQGKYFNSGLFQQVNLISLLNWYN